MLLLDFMEKAILIAKPKAKNKTTKGGRFALATTNKESAASNARAADIYSKLIELKQELLKELNEAQN